MQEAADAVCRTRGSATISHQLSELHLGTFYIPLTDGRRTLRSKIHCLETTVFLSMYKQMLWLRYGV